MKRYGEKFKQLREAHNLTQSELAKKTGISQVNIHYWENDKRKPNIEFCEILADFYGVSIDELVGHEIKVNW